MDCQSFEGQGLFHRMSWLLSHNRLCKTKFSLELTIKWNILKTEILVHQIKQICLYQYVISFARFEEDTCLNSYEIVAKLAKIFKRCLVPYKVIQIFLQFRKFFLVKSCILEISSRGMRGGGRLYTGYIWNPQSCQRLESGIHNMEYRLQILFCITLHGVTCFSSELVGLRSQ